MKLQRKIIYLESDIENLLENFYAIKVTISATFIFHLFLFASFTKFTEGSIIGEKPDCNVKLEI